MGRDINVTIRQIRERHHVTTLDGGKEILEVIAQLAELVGRNYCVYVEDRGAMSEDMGNIATVARHWINNTEGRH